MTMTPQLRKLTLTTHVATSVGWLGALAVFLAHAIASLASQDAQMVSALSLAMGVTAWFVILPLSLASLTTGIVGALGTAWGLLRHYWVIFKLLLTAVATAVLLLKLGPISALAAAATGPGFGSGDLIGLRTSLMIHAGGGLLMLLAAVVLGIYKPRGMTRYGIRRQREQDHTPIGSDAELATAIPLWVKVSGAAVAALLLLVVAMLLGGGHGPSAHMSGG